MTDRICSVEGCERPFYAKGYCPMHWKWWYKHGDPRWGSREDHSEQAFWSQVEKTDTCWLWTGHLFKDGYGMFGRSGERRAHRKTWNLVHGTIPEGMQILHTCDVPRCVNPDHLFLGTHRDNMADRNRKGRQAKGERNGFYGRHEPRAIPGERYKNARLTVEQVSEIRRQYAQGGISHRALAARFGMSQSQIGRIVRYERWGHC